ncbi:DNA-directed RNA polymerase I subunit RPA34 [Tiliqua scincoides]|uniref:DNA-directed RNA polymerase I subunit RPA34 n=1 Tax=Tiliqua scincoides TaxID=71010 RepID=UPI0034631BD0
METPEGPLRFECPVDFGPCPFSPGPGFSQETLRNPSKQLWLIRAPANFSPDRLDGHAVPLLGSQMLKVPQPNGTRKNYSFQAVPGDLDSAHLLIPSGCQDYLTCAPSFSGLLSICERFGDSGANQPLFPVAARLAPKIPKGLRQRFLPFGGHPQGPVVREVAEEPPRKKKKKKKRELHTVGYMGAPEEPLPSEYKPSPEGASAVPAGDFMAPGEAGGLREGQRIRRHKHRRGEMLPPPAVGTAQQPLPEQGTQLSSSLEGFSQEGLSSGGVTDISLKSRKKRKKQQLKKEAEELLQEPSSLLQQAGLQVACAAEGSSPGAEELLPCPPKKKKKKRRQEEEAEAAAVDLMDIASIKQEAEGGQWDFRGLEGSLGESLPSGRHKKRRKEKVLAEEPLPWEQGAGAALLGPSPVQLDWKDWAEQGPGQEGPGLPGEEGASQKHKKKRKKHKREAAEEESWPA